jgi:hypothetical protein
MPLEHNLIGWAILAICNDTQTTHKVTQTKTALRAPEIGKYSLWMG